jgi:hypothetical protein
MSELVVCPGCRRHVTTREITCPFCACTLSPARAQRVVLVGRVSRAAVFSAALAACSDDKPKSQPPPPAHGSDDLEKLLDDKPKVEHADIAPPIDAAVVVEPDAAIVDAAPPPDAGVVVKKKRRKQEQQQETVKQIDLDRIQNAKPYGAPPARRRVV